MPSLSACFLYWRQAGFVCSQISFRFLVKEKLEKERDRIRLPILEKKNRELLQELQAALQADENYQKASEDQTEAINEVLSSAAETLPEGYAVTRIDPDEGLYEAEYDPERAGQLIGDSGGGGT